VQSLNVLLGGDEMRNEGERNFGKVTERTVKDRTFNHHHQNQEGARAIDT
jgi:hypothetical protein